MSQVDRIRGNPTTTTSTMSSAPSPSFDIRFPGSRWEDWARTFAFLRRTQAEIRWIHKGLRVGEPPADLRTCADSGDDWLILMSFGGVEAQWRLGPGPEIRIEVRAAEIRSEAAARVVLRIMSTLGRRLGLRAVLTPHGRDDEELFVYTPGSPGGFTTVTR